mmetsp:Transcript_29955/g.70610  ORF Transcript_29955/g.70610 Transcript_29955/m.70610 type:complete len:844 (+) Transcript_29955:350-2881(+)|eukprot:CAMPEP_0172398136 /NCGR_PEP_ID=MMETSP1061-20121228/34377_1 /TAXON_ID=37318 /ORGANISM="Pseudo-nitzschia pungens, Strain cf. pungens" /LENGTH=843 /DNA_ID=CAMNT_0013130511 /DNA_START=340 /DNA_END=2871 /DNA_ORIENTATION=-
MAATSIRAMVGYGLGLVVLLTVCPSNASRGSALRQRTNDRSNSRNMNRVLYDYYEYDSKKSKKDSKKSAKNYYDSNDYYGHSKKNSKACKSSKGSKKGYYSDECEEIPESTETTVDSGTTESAGEDEVVESVSSKSEKKSDKKSKKNKSETTKSAKSEKKKSDKTGETDDDDDDLTYKSLKSKSKNQKKIKSKNKSPKSIKLSKKFSSKSEKKTSPPKPDEGFVPEELWKATFENAVDTGFLFFDPFTNDAWYVYNANVESDESLVSVSSASSVDINIVESKTTVVEKSVAATLGKICHVDAKTGSVAESSCIEIKPPEDWPTVTSSSIQSAEACYGSVTGSIAKLAVVVKDTSKFMHFFDDVVGSRLIVYDVSLFGKNSSSVIAEVAYEGWDSLYGEPAINSRPAFSPDCKTVYSTWLTSANGNSTLVNPKPSSTTTVATNVESVTEKGKTPELWRLGTDSRLVGLTPSSDGKTLYSAINVAEGDSLHSGGMVALDASSGRISQQYAFLSKGGIPHSAYTNVILDDSGYTYHIDSLYGLVKFDGDNLNTGPVWSAVTTDSQSAEKSITTRKLNPARPRDKENKNIFDQYEYHEQNIAPMKVNEMFTAYQPALEALNYSTVYGCGGSALGNEKDGVVALGTEEGESVWFTSLPNDGSGNVQFETASGGKTIVVDVDSCSGITDDVRWGPSEASPSEVGIYISRGIKVQCLDSEDGELLWTYAGLDEHNISKFAVVSGEAVLVANGGSVALIGTQTPEPVPSGAPAASSSPTAAPHNAPPTSIPNDPPSMKPISTPAPVNTMPAMPPTPFPTPQNSGSPGSSRPSFFSIALLSGLAPLLVFFLQ